MTITDYHKINVAGAEHNGSLLRNNLLPPDVLNDLSDIESIKVYRLDRQNVMVVTNVVWEAFMRHTKRNIARGPGWRRPCRRSADPHT